MSGLDKIPSEVKKDIVKRIIMFLIELYRRYKGDLKNETSETLKK